MTCYKLTDKKIYDLTFMDNSVKRRNKEQNNVSNDRTTEKNIISKETSEEQENGNISSKKVAGHSDDSEAKTEDRESFVNNVNQQIKLV